MDFITKKKLGSYEYINKYLDNLLNILKENLNLIIAMAAN